MQDILGLPDLRRAIDYLGRTIADGRLGHSLTDPETLERWANAEVDLLTRGYLVDAADEAPT